MPNDLSLSELSALADVPSRTIRFYIAQGLLPAPGREGPATRYPVQALHRLRLIRQLQRAHLPLAEVRKRLAALRDDEIEALAGPTPEVAPSDTALDYVRGILGRSGPAILAPAMTSPRPGGSLARAIEAPAVVPLSGPEAAGAAGDEASPAAGDSPASTTASAAAGRVVLERSQWERVVLEPDVELHIRRPLSRTANRRVERLVAFARQLLEEDRP